jgi:hypothetical protein
MVVMKHLVPQRIYNIGSGALAAVVKRRVVNRRIGRKSRLHSQGRSIWQAKARVRRVTRRALRNIEIFKKYIALNSFQLAMEYFTPGKAVMYFVKFYLSCLPVVE